MTTPRKFDELTAWDDDPGGLRAGGAGWAAPGSNAFIDRADPYWGHVLDKARTAYGDPNMGFNTDNVGQERRLVFGDGTPVPSDGALAYRDAARHQTYLLNNDGTVSPLGANDVAGQPITPAGFRRNDNGTFAPVDPSGHQIAPLTDAPPSTSHGYYDANGLLTPKNARGDYYTDDPTTGKRTYFDKNGSPITAAQFGADKPAPAHPPIEPTDEQQSGRAADAVRQLHDELANRYSQISDAEAKLSETLLNAHATTADGQQKLQAIQQKIVEAINDPAMSIDTPAGEQAFLKFLRSQIAAIGDIIKSGTLAAEDQAKTLEALANLYPPLASDAPPPTSALAPADAPQADAVPNEFAPVGGVPPEPDLAPLEAIPDPTLSDLGLGQAGKPGTDDPLASLASALPSVLGALPTAGLGAGMDPLSTLTGAAAPLAGLMSQLADQTRRADPPDDDSDDATDSTSSNDANEASKSVDSQTDSATPTAQPAPPAPTPVDGTASAAPVGAPASDTSPPAVSNEVALPDGSTVTAHSAPLAEAVTSYLNGTPVDAAYRDAGIELPPPGTPVTSPIDPSSLSCGAIGMFTDHYVVALSSMKAVDDGQVVPLSSVTGGPGFLGWLDPTAATAAASVPATAPAGTG